jgi:beta-glucuronidase
MTRRIDLGGTWDFVADLDPKYHLDTSIYPTPEYARPTANRRHWLRVPVPGVWQRYAERYDLFEGVCWFARDFSVPEIDAAAPARIRFGAVNYLCRVFVNGEEVGGHEGGYTEFTVDVTGRVRGGTNHLAVMVDNRATSIAWPPCLGYFNYGGIHRQVTLEILEGPSLDLLELTPSWGADRGLLSVRATVAGRGKLSLEVTCGNARTQSAVSPSGVATACLEVSGAAPWSPQSPAVQRVRVRLLHDGVERDSAERDVGFKSVEVREGGVYLNGARIRLNGVCYVYDSPTHGLVMEPADVDADVALMKEMGCTAVRCHYPKIGRAHV